MNYAVFELLGKQYLIKPGQSIEVDKINGTEKTVFVDKVLLLADEKGVEVGTPYLQETIRLEVVDTVKKDKVRVAIYHAKANYRRVKGQRREVTLVRLAAAKSVEPKDGKKTDKPAKKAVKKS